MSSDFAQVPGLLLLVIGLISIGLTSFFSAVELSQRRLSRALVQDLIDDGVRRAPALLALVEDREHTALSLRAARVALQTVAIVSITMALVGILGRVGWPWWAITLTALVAIGVVEFVAVSLFPYFLVRRRYTSVALAGTALTTLLVRVTRWFRPPAEADDRVRRLTAGDESALQRLVVADDLREIVDEVGEPDSIDEDDREMLRSVFELGQTLVREVMVPRTSMMTIDADATVAEALRLFVRSGFSRIPVVGDDIDDVVGILYFKDVAHRLLDHPKIGQSAARGIAREPVFIPETRRADDELRAMQSGKSHIALVVDEYGGIAGLVTIEDLLEELVGELRDEHDRFEMEPEQVEADTWRVPARFPLGDLADLLEVEIDEDTVDSVGGLLTMTLGRVALPGDSVAASNLVLTAEEAHGRRREVVSVLVHRVPVEDEQKARVADD